MTLSLCARLAVAGSLMLSSSLAWAGIQLGATRVILAAPAKEASLPVVNHGVNDLMIQSWVDAGDDAPDKDVPFVVTPALARLDGSRQQSLRVLYQGQGLPTDKESVFWLSVQEIPQKVKDKNVLQIAVRQRIKLFYRPANLPGKAVDAAPGLTWRWTDNNGKGGVEVTNPSAYYVSLSGARIRSGTQEHAVQTQMLAPGATVVLGLKDGARARPASGATVEFENVNDDGGTDKHSTPLSF